MVPRGFFTLQEDSTQFTNDGKIPTCVSCGLYKHVLSPKMQPYGKCQMGILNVGEAPEETEDRRGKQWQGKAGRMLRRAYSNLGISLFEDCANINAVNCRPTTERGANRTPTPQEISSCRRFVFKAIDKYKPKVIIALGTQSLVSLLGHRWKKNLGGISKWRGWTIPDRELGAWLCPVWHPSYVEQLGTVEAENVWLNDLKRALSMAEVPFPTFGNERDQIEIISNPDQLVDGVDLVEFDYETTGLKPQRPGHRIVCAAVASREDHAQVFMMPNSRSERAAFLDLLRDPKIGKMAHNIKFEDTWSNVRLRCPVVNWTWDSMLAAHILDNRPGVTGLKFQVYVNFGLVDYDSSISSYLKRTDDKDANAMNHVLELVRSEQDRKELMVYCGMDALFGFRLAMLQMEQIGIITWD